LQLRSVEHFEGHFRDLSHCFNAGGSVVEGIDVDQRGDSIRGIFGGANFIFLTVFILE